jgi:hypothetical protein
MLCGMCVDSLSTHSALSVLQDIDKVVYSRQTTNQTVLSRLSSWLYLSSFLYDIYEEILFHQLSSGDTFDKSVPLQEFLT